MIKIKTSKFNHVAECHEFTLENGEKLLLLEKEIDKENMEYGSIEGNKYTPVFSDREYSDDTIEIIGFEKL